MKKSNRHNLIAILASLIAVVMIFGMAVVLGGDFGAYAGNESESLDNIYDASEDTTVEKTGTVGTAITTVDGLKSFLNTNSGTAAYLANDLTISSDWGRGSNYALPANYTLDGNGHTITYTETYTASSSPNKSQYGVTCWAGTDIYVAGTFLRAISAGATLKNITFVQQNTFICKAGASADALGMIGVNNGTMENVNFVLNGKFQYNNDGGNWAEKLLGGLCAINNTDGKIYNCSATINNSMNADGRSAWSGTGYAHVSGGVALNRGTIKGITVDYISTTPSDGYHLKQTNSKGSGTTYIYGYVGGVVATNDNTVSGVCLLHAPVMSREAGAGGWATIGVGNNAATYYYYGSSVSTSASGYVSSGYRVVDSAINFQWSHTEGGSDCRVKIVPVAAQTYSDRIVWSMDGYSTLYTQATYNPVVDMATGNGASFGSNLTFGFKTSARRSWNVIDNETTGTDYNGFKYMGSNNEPDYHTTYNGTVPKLIQTFTVETQGTFYQEINCSQATAGPATATATRVYEAQKIYDPTINVNDAEVTVTISTRQAKIKLPQFIYDKDGYNSGKYSLDGSSWYSLGSISDATIKEFIVKNSTAYLAAPIGDALSGLAPTGTNTYNSSAVTNSYSKYQQPIAKTTSGTAINSQSTLESWLSGSGDGYLTGDFSINFGSQKNGSTYAIASGRTLYGNGYTITVSYSYGGWSGDAPTNVGGLFRTNAGTIKDLNYIFMGQLYMDNSTTMWSSPFVGENSGTITNCVVDYRGNYQVHGTGTAWYMLGGVVGNNKGTLSNVTFIMNTTTAASNSSNNYVLKCNFRGSAYGMTSGIAGENASSGGKIYGARYVQISGQLRADLNSTSNVPACSNISAICANDNGTIVGQMVEGTPSMYNQYASGNCRYFAMKNPSGTWTTSGSYCYVIKGTTCSERSGIVKIDVGYSDSVTSYDDVNVYFSETTSIRVNMTLVKSIVDAGNKLMQVGPTNYAAQTAYSVYWTTPTGTFGSLRYGKTLSVDAIKTDQETGANQGIMEGDLQGIVDTMKSYLSLSGASSFTSALIAGYAYDTAALKTQLINANSNYDYTIYTDSAQDQYYVVGNIDIRVNDLYHVYGREVYTWYAYNSSTHPTDYQYAIVANQVSSLGIDESLWLLDGTYYKTKVASYNNQVNAYTPTLSLDLSSDANYDKITYSGIDDTNIKKLIKLNVFNVVTTTTTTNIYIGKEMNTGNVYDLSTSQLGTASFVSFDKDGYKFTFDASGMLKTGVTYVGFAVAGNPANVDPSYLDISDATNIQVKLSRAQMETYFGTGNTFDLDLVYLYNATSATESEVKEFLAGTSGKFGGAQKLTLTGNVTISSALSSSAVVFNQYKTLDGAGYTITINTPVGGNYASTTGTTYSTPGYPTNVIGYTNYVYRGGLAAVSCGTFQNINVVLNGDFGTSTANAKSYAIGGVVGLNQGGSFSNVKVTVASNQTIGALANPAVWGTMIGISSGGSINDITIGGDRNKTITNNSGDATYRGYIGGVVGVMNLTDGDTNIGVFMADPNNSSKAFGSIDIAQPSEFYNIYNMYMGSYVGSNAFKGLVTGASYVSGVTPNIGTLSSIVYFNKSENAVPFFSLTAGKHDASVVSAYGALGQDDTTAIATVDNKLMKGVGITLKYKESYSTGDNVVLDMLDYTVSGTSIYFNRVDVRNLAFEANSKVSSVTSNGTNAYVTFDSGYFTAGSSAATTNQITAVLTMTLAVTTASGLNDFLKGMSASDALMAIVNGIGIESDITISSWDNSTLLKVDAGRTLDGASYTVTMNLTTTNKVYADYSSSDNWNGYKLVYDFIGVNDGTIQNLKFVGQTGNFSSYDLAVNHIIGSLVAVNNGTINGVTYSNNGIGTYNNSNSAGVNTVAGLVAGVNTGAITSTQVFNRALFSVVGMFGGSVGVAMGAIAGVNDGGYAETVKVFGDNAIELVSKTGGNTNTALYVGGVFGVANNHGTLTFAGKSISKATADKAVISGANVIVAGGMGIRYSGGTIMPYGSRGIFAGIATGDLGYDTGREMTGLAFMDMQTGPNLAVSYVYDAGVLSYFASDRIFNNSLSNGELTMMGYYDYGDTMPDTSCVSGGKVDIFDSHGNSVFMYNYDVTTTNSTLLGGLISYMEGGSGVTFDLQNVSSYMALNDYITKSWSSLGDSLETSGINPTLLRFFDKIGRADFATATTNNVVGGAKYKFSWSIDPSRVTGTGADEIKSNIIKGFIEGKTAQQYRVAGAATVLTLGADVTVNFDGMSAGRVLESTRQIIGNSHTLTVNVGDDTLNITDTNAENLYAIEGYDVVGVGGLFAAILGTVLELNIVVNITGGTINATGANLAVGGVAGIISGTAPTFGYVQVNYNGTTVAFDDGGKTLAFGGIFGAMYTKDGAATTNVSLKQDGTNQVNMVGVTMTGNAQNVAVGGAVGLMQGSVLQGVANPTVLYLNQNSTTASGFDFTSTVGFSGTGGLGGLVGILAGSNLLNINIDQGLSYANTLPTAYTWTKDMLWRFNGGSGANSVSAMGGAIGVSFGGNVSGVGVNSRARLINNVGTGAGDATNNYIGGLLGLGSNSGDMSLTGTADAYTETINGKTYTLTTTKINDIYAGQIGMIAMPDGGYAGYVTGRFINAKEKFGDASNLKNLVWIDFTRKQADLYGKIQVFGATDTAGITLSNVAGMSVLGYVSTDMYNTLTQAGYNKSGVYGTDTDKLATYTKISACDFKGTDISIALAAYIVNAGTMSGHSLNIRLIGTLTTGGGGYTPYSTDVNATGTEYLKSWTAQVMAADNKTGLQDAKPISSGVLSAQTPYSDMYYFTYNDGSGKHNNLRIQLFRNEVLITTEAQLKEFISSDDSIDAGVTGYANATAGTLGANITLTQDVNYYKLNKDLYGNNYTITLVAETPKINVASFPLISMSGTPTTNNHTDVFGLNANETPILDTDTRIAGLFVGALMTGKVIEGVNFYLNSQVWVVTGVPTNYTDRPDSLVGGLVTAINLGTISNCKLELGANANYVLNRTIVDFNGYGDQYSQSNMCIAGGFAGMNIGKGTSYATIENCTLNMDDSAIFRSICEARRFPRSSYYPKAQAIAGGMVGWVGARSNLVNSTLNGGGLIEASTRGVICFDSVSAWASYGDVEYVRQNILQSGAGALLGVNTNNYVYTGGNADHNNTINTECVIYDANGNYTGTVTKDYKTAAYTNVRSEYHQNVTVDGVIINWYGFTIERIYIHVDNHNAGGLGGIISDVYDNVEGMQTVDETDRPILDGGNYNKGKTSIIYGYRQIAGICDWEKINNAYLVSGSAAGTTPAAGIAGWESRDHGTGNDHWSYFGTALPGNKTIPAKYVGRGGVLGATKSIPYELYVFDNTDPTNIKTIDKTALGQNVGLSWVGTGTSANLSFDFTIADPTAEGKFLWDTQVWQVKPDNNDLLNAKPEDGVASTEGDGWTSPSRPNLLFYNDVYDKINNLSDAIHYADVSHTFSRGNNVYLYYSYGTTGSASIDRNEYYYDTTTGVYYHKTTTSYGNSFGMPALKFYGSDGTEITNSSVSNTLFSSILVDRFTGKDPTNEANMTAVATTPIKDGSGNTVGVNVNDPAAGSYRISFDTKSEASIGSAIKDISSKTIIFPENDIVSGNFKIVEIVTPLGLRAGDMTFIAEKGASVNSSANLHLDVAQILVGGVNVLSGNGDYNYNGINYASKIDGVKPAAMTTSTIGMTEVKINLEDWEYYGYVPATNSLGTNRSYLIAGSGFTLEYDFEDANNNSYTKLDGTNVKFEVSGSQVTLQGRGLVIPVDSKIDYVQKTYNGSNATTRATVSYGKVLSNSTSSTGAPSFERYDDANAGNDKTVYMSMSRITFEGYKYKIDRYYQSSGFAMRAASATNSNNTIDNWKNSVDVEASPKSSHQFANALTASGSGKLKTASAAIVQVKSIGTILPQEITVKYIAKEYDGTATIDYSKVNFSYSGGTTGLKPNAAFGSASVVYGGQNKYNSIVFGDVVTIVDQTDSSVLYALTDANSTYGNNYAIANSGTYNSTAKTFTLPNLGVIVPQAVKVNKAKKTYDGNSDFVSGMTYTLAKVSNSETIQLSALGLSSLSASNGSFADANVGEGKSITIKGTTQFVYPDATLGTEYGTRYFATSTAKDYAYSATTYTTGVIIPKQLTWASNIANLVYKTYDATTTYTYSNASTLLSGLVSGDTTTKPTITFASSDVNTAGVGISIATTRNAIDGTYYDQINGYTNYYMPISTAKGMILPATVTFSGITKVYDGNETLTDTVYSNMSTTVVNSPSLTSVKLYPVGQFDARHAYTDRQVVWTTTTFVYNATTYNILQEAKTATSGKNYAGNYCVAGNSDADITPCTLTAADFESVSATQNKGDVEHATGLTFVYFAGAVYLVSGNVKKKNNADVVDGDYKLYKSSSLASTNADGTYDVGTYDINVTALTGTDAGNYTLAVPFDLGQDVVITQQEVANVAITVMPTNKDYGADLPTATAKGWSAKDSVTGGEISGVTFGISAYQWVDDSDTAVTKTSPIGGYNLKVNGITMSGNNNYKLASGATYSVTVTPSGAKALYILPLENTISKVEKVYDRTTALGTVTATQTIANYVGEYESKNVQGYNAIAMGNVKIKVITFTYYDNSGVQQTKYVIAIGNETTMSNYYLDVTPTDGYAVLQVGVITPKEVSISGAVRITQEGSGQSKTADAPGNFEYYSTATYSYSATLTGVISGDTVGVSITDPCAGVYDAGTYDLTFNGLTGADAGNYVFNGTLSAQLIVIPQTLASVSVSVKPINVVYGNAIPTTVDGATAEAYDKIATTVKITANFTISGFTTTATSGSPIGGYDITIDYGKVGIAGNDNYVVGSTTAIDVVVTPAGAKALYIIPADATLDSVTKTYDGTSAFTGETTIVTTPASVAVTGAYADKNAGTGKAVKIDVEAFSYFNADGEVVVRIFKGTNYKVANALAVVDGDVATINVGVINKYAIKGSEITGVTVTQTWKGNTSTTSPFTYYYTATYAAAGTFNKFAEDTVTVVLGIYKSTDGSHIDLSGATNVGVGEYKISLLSVSASPENFKIDTAEQYSNDTVVKINPQIVTNVYVVGNHYATVYTGASLTYDKAAANFKIYAIDLDDIEVNISGEIKENGLTVGKDGQAFATGQTEVGIYNVKVSVNGSAEGNNYTFSAIDNADVYIDANMTAKTEFAIIPMVATLETAYKTYDGNKTLAGATVVLNDANSAPIDFGTAVVRAEFDNSSAGNRKLVFITSAFAYYPTGTTSKTTLNIIQTSTSTPAEGEGEASLSTTITNYHIGSSNTVDGKAYIVPKTVTITVLNKVYDGTKALNGKVNVVDTINNEEVTFVGEFADCNAGTGKAVEVKTTALSLVNGETYNVLTTNGNYCIAKDAVFTGDIAQREFTKADLGSVKMIQSPNGNEIEIYPTANSAEYSWVYEYLLSAVTGSVVMNGATFDGAYGNWSLKLYQSIDQELATENGFAINIQMFKGSEEVVSAKNAGKYTVKIALSGTNYFTNGTIDVDFVITKQKVDSAENISVFMNSFDGEYGTTGFDNPSAGGKNYRIGIIDKYDETGNTIVYFDDTTFNNGHTFAIASLAFSKTVDGTPQAPITATGGVYIGAYYLFAASVTGASDNFDTAGLTLDGKAIFGIDNTSQQSMYFIKPALLNVTSVTKTYDGNTDTATAAFAYNGGKTEALSATYASHMSTHNSNGSLADATSTRTVNFKTSAMNVATSTGNVSYAIALKADGTTNTNYYIDGTPDGEGYIAVDGVAIIKKYVITDGVMTVNVTGYVKDNKELQVLPLNKDTTATFVYADGYTYDGSKFTVTGLKPTQDKELFNASDDIADMTIFISGTIKNAGSYTVILDRLVSANYEMTGATLGTIVIEKQIVTEDRVVINIPYLVNTYNGAVQKPESSDQFSFIVKDYYTDRDVKSNASSGGGLSAFKYYSGDYVDGAASVEPKNIGRYSVSVVVDTSFIDAANYTFDGSVTEITKFAQEGKAVYFILPIQLTVTGVYKEYDGTTAFGTPIVVNAEDTTGAKTIITLNTSGILEGDADGVYAQIIAASGTFADKNIKVQGGDLIGGDVRFNASRFNYFDAEGKSQVAYFIGGTNYAIAGTGLGSYVTVSNVGVITPVAVGYTSLTKTYDGTNLITYKASADYNKTTEVVSGKLSGDSIVGATGYYYSASAGVGEVGTGIDVYLQYQIVTYKGIQYYTLVNDPNTTASNAGNYYVFSIDADSNVTYPASGVHPTDEHNGYVKIAGIGEIKKVAIDIGGSSTTENGNIYNIQFQTKSNAWYAYNNSTAFVYRNGYLYGVDVFKATIGFNENQKTSDVTYDGAEFATATGINGDVLYFKIYFNNNTSTVKVGDAGSYTLFIQLVKVMNGGVEVINTNYELIAGNAGTFKINKQELGASNVTLKMDNAVSTTYNGKANNLTVVQITGISGAVATDQDGYSVSVGGTITATDFAYVGDAPINAGGYALTLKVSGLTSNNDNYSIKASDLYNVTLTGGSSAVYTIAPKEIKLSSSIVKNFDGTTNFVVDVNDGSESGNDVIVGEKLIVGGYAEAGYGSNALAGSHTFAIGNLAIVNVLIDAESIGTTGFNETLIKEDGTVDFDKARGNYTIAADTDVTITINPSNIVVAERRYDGAAEIEVASTGLAGKQFLRNNVDDTNLAGVLKISVNGFASFETATTDEIGTIQEFTTTDELGYETYTIVFKYVAQQPLDDATYTDRYVFAIAGANGGYSTNLALTSSELADGQTSGAAITTGTAVGTAQALATALQSNVDIYLTSNIYGWDAQVLEGAVNYTGALYGNGYSIQLVGGLNSDTTYGGAFISSLGGTIQDVNFKFTSDKTLSGATTVGLVVGNMTGNMTNVSLDIINSPTFDGATTIGGLAGSASGSMTNATVIFNASVDNTAFGGLAGNATGATFSNVSVRAYNGKTTTGKTLVATATGCTFDGVIDMIGGALGVSSIDNLYTVNTSLTSAKAYGKLELLTPYTEGFIEYFFTTLAKTGNATHNVYGGTASERDKTMYQTYGTVSGTVLAIETLAPRNRFIWEAYSHSYQTEVGSGHINMSLNRYVTLMPIGTIIEEDGYTIGGNKTTMTFITSGVNMFCPAIGIRGGQEIAASGSTIVEAVYTGDPITHTVEITVDGITTTVSVTGTEAGYYDNIVKELEGDVTTDNINYDTYNRIAIVAAIEDGSNVAGAILIIYPKQTALGDNFSKTYDTTSIGEFTTTVDGKSVTLLGTYVDNTDTPASDVGTSKVSFANTLNPIRNVLVDVDGNYIAQHHKTDAEGKITFSYTKISVTTLGGVESNFTTSTDITTLTKNSLMRAIAQLIDYDKATTNDTTLTGNSGYKSVWVYNVTAIKAADSAGGYFDEDDGLFFVPKTINTNSGNFTFTDSGLTFGSLTNIYIGETQPSVFAVLADNSSATIKPAQLGATYTGDLEQCFRSTSLSTNVALTKGEWVDFTLPTTMTESQKTAFNTFKTKASVAVTGSVILGATSGISESAGVYTANHDKNTIYLELDLPSQFDGLSESGVNGANYVIKPTAQVLKLRYFFKEGDKYILETYNDVLTIGKTVEGSDYHTLDYVMKNNINMKSSLITPFDWGNGIVFEGSIDGQGYALTNYILKGENNVGLFASMGATASVTDLVMGNVMVVSTATSGNVTVSAISTTGTVTDVATEARVVTATTGSVAVANAGQSFVRVHKQSAGDTVVTTLLGASEIAQDTYLTPMQIEALTKFGGVANFLDKYVFNNAKLTYTATADTITVGVNNFREYWGWYNICPWLEGGTAWLEGGGIRPTKTNVTVADVA